jgi:hypothetical protein
MKFAIGVTILECSIVKHSRGPSRGKRKGGGVCQNCPAHGYGNQHLATSLRNESMKHLY